LGDPGAEREGLARRRSCRLPAGARVGLARYFELIVDPHEEGIEKLGELLAAWSIRSSSPAERGEPTRAKISFIRPADACVAGPRKSHNVPEAHR
jgi:hypothetical protein